MNNMQNDPQMQQYFNTLPAYMQESIKQCSPEFTSVEDMRKFVENVNKPKQSN